MEKEEVGEVEDMNKEAEEKKDEEEMVEEEEKIVKIRKRRSKCRILKRRSWEIG